MISEVEVIDHMNDVVLVLTILNGIDALKSHTHTHTQTHTHTHLPSQGVKDLHFHKGLVMEPLLVSDDLQCYWVVYLVIKALWDGMQSMIMYLQGMCVFVGRLCTTGLHTSDNHTSTPTDNHNYVTSTQG